MVVRLVTGAFLMTLTLLTLLGLPACKPAAAGPPAGPPPAPKVTVAHPIVRDVTKWDEYTGRLEAVETVDVKAQVSGLVDSVTFKEGSIVNKGDLLLTIDSRIFQAQLDSDNADLLVAKAKLEQQRATLQLAENDFRRAQEASTTGGISAGEFDTRRFTVAQEKANVGAAEASIVAAEATIKFASQYVEWCKITAPISGRISNRVITSGNMLNGGAGQNTTVITTIKSIDPIYLYIDIDEASVLRYQKLARENKQVTTEDARIPCYMQLGNETNFPHVGEIDFVDNRIDPATGTQRARAVFPNPDGALIPGSFARLRLTGQAYPGAVLVIDDAIGLDQDHKYLYVLLPDNSVERRTVTTGPLIGELRAVLTDLKSDELVLVNGIMNLAFLPPGGHVNPTTVPMPESRVAGPARAAAPTTKPAASAPATSEGAK